MQRTFKFRLRANQHFVAEAERWLSICCDLYNAGLQERRDAYRISHKSVNYYEQQAQLKEIRADHEDLRNMSYGVQADALRRLDKAFCDCGLDIDRDVNAARNILASASPAGKVAQAA